MNKSRWNKLLALVLTLVLLASTVSASGYTLDLSGDGKVNVWDMQVAVNENKEAAHQEAILTGILGGGDELHKNAQGEWEIWSATGLYRMAANEMASTDGSNTYTLMCDIDLSGYDWVPVAPFRGTFKGNDHTISNVTITKAATRSTTNMGFFGNIYSTGVISDLNLRNVSVTATEKANYMGLFAGTNAGKVTNVTATGSITDTRTAKPASDPLCYGALAGRCILQAGATVTGSLQGGTSVSVTDGAGKYTTTGLCADVKLLISASVDASGKTIVSRSGVAGWAKDASLVSGIYCDSTYSTALLPQELQDRRNTVESYMEEMGTVEWTPSETIYYTAKGSKTSVHSNAYIAGNTYIGIPYNHSAGSLERFMTGFQAQKDSQGRLVTVTGLEDGVYITTPTVSATGFIQYMGNDCSASIGWAWATISPARNYVASDKIPYYGTYARLTRYMVPNPYNQASYGMYPVGDYALPQGDTTLYPYSEDVRNTRAIIEHNGGGTGMAEYYAMSRKGDVLVYNLTSDATEEGDDISNNGGHARMIAEDPVVIRNSRGVIDLNKSYFLTHEQGDGLFDNRNASGKYDTYNGYNVKQTSWRVNYKYTFSTLLTEAGYKAVAQPGCGWGYIPVTMKAFTADSLKTPYLYKNTEHPVTAPNVGWIYSNYRTLGATLVIKDASGAVVYEKTGWNGVGESSSVYRTRCDTTKLDVLFPDATEGLTPGAAYTYTVTCHFSDGTSKDYYTDAAYTHPG